MPASDTAVVDRPGGSLSFPGLLGLSAAHAACFHLAFDPVGLWPLVLVALAPLGLIALRARSTRAALAAVIPVQWAANLVSTAWMIGITPLGYVLLGLYVALFAGLFVWIVRRATRHLPRVPLVVIVPIAWVGVECLRGHLLFHGYPWFLLGHPLIGWLSLVQSVDLFGVGFASFIAALVAGAVTECIVNGTAPRARAAVAAAGLLLVANIAYGAVRLRGAPDPAAAGRRGPSMLVTQTNLLQDNKHHWTPQAMETDLPAFIDATRAGFAAAAPPVDLVVWPETMVPGAGFEPAANALLRDAAMSDPGRYRHMHHWADEVTALQAALGVPMLVGSTAWPDARLERDGNVMRARIDTQYNAAYLLDGPPPHARYDKHHLTPFGETMPYISSWDWLEQKLLSIGAAGMAFNLDASAAVSTLELKGVDGPWHLGTPICYEDTVSRVCRDMVWEGGRKRVDVLVNLSNDGWFADAVAGRDQHNQIARFRCIENRVPMVRAANTGQSVGIDSSGRVIAVIGDGRYGTARQGGTLLVRTTLDGRRTLYGRIGDSLSWLCLGVMGLLLCVTFVTRPSYEKETR